MFYIGNWKCVPSSFYSGCGVFLCHNSNQSCWDRLVKNWHENFGNSVWCVKSGHVDDYNVSLKHCLLSDTCAVPSEGSRGSHMSTIFSEGALSLPNLFVVHVIHRNMLEQRMLIFAVEFTLDNLWNICYKWPFKYTKFTLSRIHSRPSPTNGSHSDQLNPRMKISQYVYLVILY